MTLYNINNLPTHHQLYISHNEHNTNYESVNEYLISKKLLEDVDKEELKSMQRLNSIWEIQLYPNTPISFYWCAGATIERTIELMLENYESGRWI